jgi:hypothetical protein
MYLKVLENMQNVRNERDTHTLIGIPECSENSDMNDSINPIGYGRSIGAVCRDVGDLETFCNIDFESIDLLECNMSK